MSPKFNFEGEVFKNNQGKIQIGETIYNYGDEQIVINQSILLEKIEQLHKLVTERNVG